VDADELVTYVKSLKGVEVVVASAESGAPESAWGDVFFSLPGQRMPFATIVKSDYPGLDDTSQLNRDGVFRLNLAIGREALQARFALDVFFPHPVYASHGWISILNPANNVDEVRKLVELAHSRVTQNNTD
jgi:Family of unknown function (DUF6194)